jgi:electron transport complex protein RnfD
MSSSPHLKTSDSIDRLMIDVVIAMLPAAIIGIYFFGARALMHILISVATCILAEWLYNRITKRNRQ